MKVWKVLFKAVDANVESIFDKLTILAENFDEAVKKAKQWKQDNFPSLELEISAVMLESEVDIE